MATPKKKGIVLVNPAKALPRQAIKDRDWLKLLEYVLAAKKRAEARMVELNKVHQPVGVEHGRVTAFREVLHWIEEIKGEL